jgi:hypothetical protein
VDVWGGSASCKGHFQCILEKVWMGCWGVSLTQPWVSRLSVAARVESTAGMARPAESGKRPAFGFRLAISRATATLSKILWRKTVEVHAASILTHMNEGEGSLRGAGGWSWNGKLEVGLGGRPWSWFVWLGRGATLRRQGRRWVGRWIGWLPMNRGGSMRGVVMGWEGKAL